jgi:hypothetical protein
MFTLKHPVVLMKTTFLSMASQYRSLGSNSRVVYVEFIVDKTAMGLALHQAVLLVLLPVISPV